MKQLILLFLLDIVVKQFLPSLNSHSSVAESKEMGKKKKVKEYMLTLLPLSGLCTENGHCGQGLNIEKELVE